MGQSIDINDTLHYVVSAVMEPFRHTYLNHYDIVLPLEQQALAEQHLSGEQYEGMVYLRMHEGVKIEEHEQEVQDALREAAMQAKGERIRKMNYNLRPLRSLYFSPEVTGATQHGSLVRVKAMLLAGLIILLFALMNYVNLTVSMSGFRMHEMAMRRLLASDCEEMIPSHPSASNKSGNWKATPNPSRILMTMAICSFMLMIVVGMPIQWWRRPSAHR